MGSIIKGCGIHARSKARNEGKYFNLIQSHINKAHMLALGMAGHV